MRSKSISVGLMSEFTNRKEAIPKSKKVSSRTHENYEIKDIIEILQHMTYVQPGPVISFSAYPQRHQTD